MGVRILQGQYFNLNHRKIHHGIKCGINHKVISRRIYIFAVVVVVYHRSTYDIMRHAICRCVIKIGDLEGNNMGSCKLCVIEFVLIVFE